MSWHDIERALVNVLQVELNLRAATRVPDNVELHPKFVRVIRGPGGDDGITDSPLIDVEAFAQDYGTAARLAEQLREFFHNLTGRLAYGVLIDRVTTAVSPHYVDYGNPGTHRFVASYRLEYRQH